MIVRRGRWLSYQQSTQKDLLWNRQRLMGRKGISIAISCLVKIFLLCSLKVEVAAFLHLWRAFFCGVSQVTFFWCLKYQIYHICKLKQNFQIGGNPSSKYRRHISQAGLVCCPYWRISFNFVITNWIKTGGNALSENITKLKIFKAF